MEELLARIDSWYDSDARGDEVRADFEAALQALEAGELRAARHDGERWVANASVKRAILLGFRLGTITDYPAGGLQFADKDTYPRQTLDAVGRNIRIVPGGSSVRRGAYIGPSVTMMPPAYVNVGAYVGEGTMIDSHALVGSCAQIGRKVHVSAGAQIGGVLEPVGDTPVIVEDGALIGGNTGLYEGVQVGKGAVIAAGCVITASTPVFDLVHERVLRAASDAPLRIPEDAVVVPGSRPARGDFAAEHGLHLQALMIVKYRDASTSARVALEEALR